MVIPTAAVCTMTWITVIWSINAGATLTLAAFCGAVRSKQRENRWDLLFSCSAVAAAVISAFELWMMRGGGDLRVRVMDDACLDSGAIPTAPALDHALSRPDHR